MEETLKRSDYLSRRFDICYPSRVMYSNSYTDLKPIVSLLKEFANYVSECGEEAFYYVKSIEEDLYKKGKVPFMVTSLGDIVKIDKLPDSDNKEALRYVWIGLRARLRRHLALKEQGLSEKMR